MLKKILEKHPDRIPILLVVNSKDLEIPRKKYLVPDNWTMSDLIIAVRRHNQLKRYEALFFFVNNTLVPNTMNIREVYREQAEPDGLLHVHVTKENVFG